MTTHLHQRHLLNYFNGMFGVMTYFRMKEYIRKFDNMSNANLSRIAKICNKFETDRRTGICQIIRLH